MRLTDDAIFQCPFIFMEDAGTANFTDIEVTRLREYLQGRLPFRFGLPRHSKRASSSRIDGPRSLRGEFPIVDLTPPNDHPLWNVMLPVPKIVQFASIPDVAPDRRRHYRAVERRRRAGGGLALATARAG